MVTTFNDRIIHLKRRVAPLVGKPSALLLSRDPSNRNTNISSTGMQRRQTTPPTSVPPPQSFSAADAKRRRLDELRYTAATVHQALEDAGRPPVSLLTRRVRALPNSVNTDSCVVISSAEYDAAASITAADADDANNTQDGNSGVDEMLLYESLIRSTRHYYSGVDTASLVTPRESTNDDDDEDGIEEVRASSDTTSTWAPSSLCNQVNLNDKKTIDNDNRSDAMSSNPASSACGEEASDISFSDQCDAAEDSPSPIGSEKECLNENIAGNGNSNNSSDDLNNSGNLNNDAEHNNGRRNSDTTYTAGGSTYYFVAG